MTTPPKPSLLILSALLVLFGYPAAAQDKATRIHWVGSAWMKYHGLAEQCSAWLDGRPGFGKVTYSDDRIWPLHALMEEKPKMLQLYDKARTLPGLLADLKSRDYDVLVAAVQLEMVAKDSVADSLGRTFAFLSSEAERRKARLVFAAYGTAFSDDCARGMERLRPLAKKHHATICPWWSAMKIVVTERPNAVLFGVPTKGHPALGSIYLNLCAFTFALTNTAPEQANLPLEFRGWDAAKPPELLPKSEANYFQQVAWRAWLDVRP
jgi:hypothetical protein